MASFRKTKTGWRAEVFRKGQRRSKVLKTRQEARDWAARTEYEIENAEEIASASTFGEVMDRYAREVSPSKRGMRWEQIRLTKMQSSPIGRKRISDLPAQDFADWRETRLSKKLDVLELARMIGHRNINQLMTYYRAGPSEIAEMLG